MFSRSSILTVIQNDGGSIPTRRDLVKEGSDGPSKSQLFEVKQLNGDDNWKLCAFTRKQLLDKIVSDYKGRLYNKEGILEYLLSPDKYSHEQLERVRHISSIKDIVELKITTADGDGDNDKWVCPISKKESGRFVYIAECGHVFSESALKNIEDTTCLICDETFDHNNIIIVNPVETKTIEDLENRMVDLREKGLTHSLRKKKKNKESSKKRKESSKFESDAKKSKTQKIK